MRTIIKHMCANVQGMLTNFKYPRDYIGMFTDDDGRELGPDEARQFLFDQLAMGRKVIPCSPCDNFDYSGGGCQGHPVEEEAV